MKSRAIKAVIKKDISAITSSPQMWLPMVIVPLMFVVVLPAVFLILGRSIQFSTGVDDLKFVQQFLNGIPEGSVKAQLAGFTSINQQLVYLLINYVFAPLFLMVPTMVASIVAAASFVGEKEKKTLETLLFSPMGEMEMFVAKILASFIPSMFVTIVGFLLFSIEFAVLGAPLFGHVVLPPVFWLAVVFWLAPTLSLLVIFLNVLVSVKVKGFQEAQQMSVIVILPLLFLVYGQIGGIVFLSTTLVLCIGLVALIADVIMIRAAAKVYNRDKLFSTQVF
jgi:ABC-2 type transport system permease protein